VVVLLLGGGGGAGRGEGNLSTVHDYTASVEQGANWGGGGGVAPFFTLFVVEAEQKHGSIVVL
jgi:hypothetical protein